MTTSNPVKPSLFRAADREAILKRIESLEPGRAAPWGRMSAAQMLAHCQVPIAVATGDVVLKRSLMGLLFGRMAKRKLLAPGPFAKGLPTAPQFVVRDERDFARERNALVALVRAFGENGPTGLTKEAHPFFGHLTVDEWDELQFKHLDHHLRQFGA